MLFVMGVGFLLDSPLIVFHSMCVFRLWSQCPSRCSFHMPDLCVCMAWLMSLFKCSVGSILILYQHCYLCMVGRIYSYSLSTLLPVYDGYDLFLFSINIVICV